MGYFSGFNDGFSFNNLGRTIGLKGIKPMLDHAGDSIGLNGFDKAGKAHGTNALGGLLVFGGGQALGGLGGFGGAGGAGSSATGGLGGFFEGLTGGTGGGSSMSGGLLDFSGGQSAAPIVDASRAASPQTVQGLGAASGGSGGMMSSLTQGLDVANKAGGLLGGFGGGQQPQQQPMQHAQANPQVFASLMNPTDQVDMEKRRQAQQMAVQGLLGGYRG